MSSSPISASKGVRPGGGNAGTVRSSGFTLVSPRMERARREQGRLVAADEQRHVCAHAIARYAGVRLGERRRQVSHRQPPARAVRGGNGEPGPRRGRRRKLHERLAAAARCAESSSRRSIPSAAERLARPAAARAHASIDATRRRARRGAAGRPTSRKPSPADQLATAATTEPARAAQAAATAARADPGDRRDARRGHAERQLREPRRVRGRRGDGGAVAVASQRRAAEARSRSGAVPQIVRHQPPEARPPPRPASSTCAATTGPGELDPDRRREPAAPPWRHRQHRPHRRACPAPRSATTSASGERSQPRRGPRARPAGEGHRRDDRPRPEPVGQRGDRRVEGVHRRRARGDRHAPRRRPHHQRRAGREQRRCRQRETTRARRDAERPARRCREATASVRTPTTSSPPLRSRAGTNASGIVAYTPTAKRAARGDTVLVTSSASASRASSEPTPTATSRAPPMRAKPFEARGHRRMPDLPGRPARDRTKPAQADAREKLMIRRARGGGPTGSTKILEPLHAARSNALPSATCRVVAAVPVALAVCRTGGSAGERARSSGDGARARPAAAALRVHPDGRSADRLRRGHQRELPRPRAHASTAARTGARAAPGGPPRREPEPARPRTARRALPRFARAPRRLRRGPLRHRSPVLDRRARVSHHDLLPLPYTEDLVGFAAERAAHVQRRLGRPFGLENLSSYVAFDRSTLSEHDFYAAVVRSADCWSMLDVNNVYVSSQNHGFDPDAYLAGIDFSRVLQVHIAGHVREPGGTIVDTHDQPVDDAVWALYRRAWEIGGPFPTLLERDANVPSLARAHPGAGACGGDPLVSAREVPAVARGLPGALRGHPAHAARSHQRDADRHAGDLRSGARRRRRGRAARGVQSSVLVSPLRRPARRVSR